MPQIRFAAAVSAKQSCAQVCQCSGRQRNTVDCSDRRRSVSIDRPCPSARQGSVREQVSRAPQQHRSIFRTNYSMHSPGAPPLLRLQQIILKLKFQHQKRLEQMKARPKARQPGAWHAVFQGWGQGGHPLKTWGLVTPPSDTLGVSGECLPAPNVDRHPLD